MKLESLKSSKFEAFKENAMTNLFAIVGGRCYNSKNSQGVEYDRYETGTGNADPDGNKHWVIEDGVKTPADRYIGICQVGPSVGMRTLFTDHDANPTTPEIEDVVYEIAAPMHSHE